jgi:hypothetical protein
MLLHYLTVLHMGGIQMLLGGFLLRVELLLLFGL